MTMPMASQVRVWLCGGGPGLYFDFDTFNFHVPTKGLSCASSRLPAASTTTSNAKIRILRFIWDLLQEIRAQRDWESTGYAAEYAGFAAGVKIRRHCRT